LFEIISSLKEQGITVVYISHRIREIFEIADRVTVLKDGKVVGTEIVENVNESTLVRMMIGRTLDTIFPEKGEGGREPILSVRGLTRASAFKDITFELYKGEILGLAGLVGAGRTEVARVIFGADPMDDGEVMFDGQPITIKSPRDSVSRGVGLVPEDRRAHGLVLCLPVRSNIVLPILGKIKRLLFSHKRKEKEITNQLISSLDIKTPSTEHEVELLSGGNQQKVVLAKWLAAAPQVIIFDEPTRGIDVGAKAEIHRLMRELANQGTGILMISSELPEILGMSDRVLVMSGGQLSATFSADQVTEEKVMAAATGVWQS
jgi:ribose transport system ATP-binding protein